MLLHAIAVALVVGTIAVPLCLFRFVYRFVKKPATSIMDHHLNPWSSVPSERPYVLECDRDSVAEYNAKYDKCRAEKYRLAKKELILVQWLMNVSRAAYWQPHCK